MVSPRAPRRTAEETRAAILDAAERRLKASGPASIRLQDVAAEAGISHPAVLHHFGSREGLVQAVRHLSGRRGPSNHTRLAEAVVDHVRDRGPNPTPPEEIDDVMRCCEAIGQGIEAARRAATSR